MLSSHIYAVGLYDANYENNLLKISLIKVGDVVYEVTMIREDSAELARLGCTEFCFRLASAEIAKDYASSIYSFYDSSKDVATIDNLWFENRVYKVSLKNMGVINGGQYFNLVNADVKQGLPVYLTSYENKNNIGFEETMLDASDLTVSRVDPTELGWNERSVTFGDFLQNNTITAFVSSGRARGLFENSRRNNLWDYPGVGYFLAQNILGEWYDVSHLLFDKAEDRDTCISLSYALTADFNNDGKPDIYAACHSIDFGLTQAEIDQLGPERLKDVLTEDQILFLSTPSGKYKRQPMGLDIYGHKAAAADLDGDGNVDLITTDAFNSNNRLPFLLKGNGDGTFTRDDSFINSEIMGGEVHFTVWNIFLIPYNGDTVLGMGYSGDNTNQTNTRIYMQKNSGKFDFEKPIIFELTSNANNKVFTPPLDLVFANGNIYLHGTFSDQPIGEDWGILKYDINGKFIQRVYSYFNATATLQPYSAQIKPTNRGTFIAYTAGCARDLSQGMCAMDVPITVASPTVAYGFAPVVSITGGNNQFISDADNIKGETVTLTATATDSDGTIVSTQWLVSRRVVATGTTATLSLLDGATSVTFRATDNSGATSSTTATITVAAPKPLFYYGTSLNDNINQDDLKLPDWSFIYGGAGDDTITVRTGTAVGDAGNDVIIGTSGGSSVVYWSSPSGIIADLSSGIVEDGFGNKDTLTNIRSIQGSPYDDRIKGSQFDESFAGLGGNNFVDGGGGNDTYTVFRKNAYERSKILYEKTTDTFIIEYVDDSGVTYRDTLVNITTVYLESENGFVRISRNDYI